MSARRLWVVEIKSTETGKWYPFHGAAYTKRQAAEGDHLHKTLYPGEESRVVAYTPEGEA